jgi:hypothetical protein
VKLAHFVINKHPIVVVAPSHLCVSRPSAERISIHSWKIHDATRKELLLSAPKKAIIKSFN